jgi:hypothetical protein
MEKKIKMGRKLHGAQSQSEHGSLEKKFSRNQTPVVLPLLITTDGGIPASKITPVIF